jgi:hypothetical protein
MSTLPLPAESRLELANRLFREFYASCFWHHRPDLVITEDLIPLVVQGLRSHGGRKGLLAAARLTSLGALSAFGVFGEDGDQKGSRPRRRVTGWTGRRTSSD